MSYFSFRKAMMRPVLLVPLLVLLGCDSDSDPAASASDEMTLEFFSEIIATNSIAIGTVKEGTSTLGWVSFEHGFLTPGSGFGLQSELRVLADRIDVVVIAKQGAGGTSAIEGHHFIAKIYRFPEGQRRVRVLVEFPGTDEATRVLSDGLAGLS